MFVQPLPCRIEQIQGVELSPVPLITSTGREELVCSSLLDSPDLGEDLKDFLNSASYQSLHASLDKESEITMVTLSQSSHGSVNKKSTICTNLEVVFSVSGKLRFQLDINKFFLNMNCVAFHRKHLYVPKEARMKWQNFSQVITLHHTHYSFTNVDI